MRYKVYLARSAKRDLQNIFEYIALGDSFDNAEYVEDQIRGVIASLNEFPERGVYPKELVEQGIREYRELFFKPYRIVYQVEPKKVMVLLIADGRRNMAELLQARLFGW